MQLVKTSFIFNVVESSEKLDNVEEAEKQKQDPTVIEFHSSVLGAYTVEEGEQLHIQLLALSSDSESNVKYSCKTGCPEDLILSQDTGVISWVPHFSDAANYKMVFAAESNEIAVEKEVDVTVTHVNKSPVFNESVPDNASVDENSPLSITLSASDFDGDSISYSCSASCPEGLTVNSASGVIAWTPTYSDSGEYSVVFSASDSELSVQKSISITVNNVNRAPQFLSGQTNSYNLTEGLASSFSVFASDPDDDTLVFSCASGCPTSLTINSSTGLVNFTPANDESGAYATEFSIFDGSLSNTLTVNLTVADAPQSFFIALNEPPIRGRCTLLTVTTVNESSTTIAAVENISFDLTGTGTFYSDSLCANTVASAQISAGSSSHSLYYLNNTLGVETLEVETSDSSISGTVDVTWRLLFTDNTTGAGFTTNDYGEGIAVADYNNDGWVDLAFGRIDDSIHRNVGNKTFDNTDYPGDIFNSPTKSMIFADINNNGFQDLLASDSGFLELSINEDGSNWTLYDTLALTGDASDVNNPGQVVLLDVNMDGFLDIWVPNGSTDQAVFMNDKNAVPSFTTVLGSTIGLDASDNGESVISGDFTGNGQADVIYVFDGRVFFFVSDGDGTFTESGASRGLGTGFGWGSDFGLASGDYDADGDLDLVVGSPVAYGFIFFENDGVGNFTNTSIARDVFYLESNNRIPSGIQFADFDNDGDLDIIAVRENNATLLLYMNDGTGQFVDKSSLYFNPVPAKDAKALSVIDYDNDGDLDFVFTLDNLGAVTLYENQANNSNYLKVKVKGKLNSSPVDGHFAKVELYNAAGTVRYAYTELNSSGGMYSGKELMAHFGLNPNWGGAEGAYQVKVTFPSGTVETINAVIPAASSLTVGGNTVSQMILVTEP